MTACALHQGYKGYENAMHAYAEAKRQHRLRGGKWIVRMCIACSPYLYHVWEERRLPN